MIKRIGMLTSGGDCQALNATMRGVVKGLTNNVDELEVYGFDDGYKGLIYGKYRMLTSKDFSGILTQGGTILGTTNRDNPFKFAVEENGELVYYDKRAEVLANLEKHGIEALVVIGGDGSLNIAARLAKECGIKVVGVPKTIDNDLPCTERTFGFDTAMAMATEALDRIHTTAESHHRVMALEVMGRYAGWIALHSGIAGGADVILIPEIPYSINSVIGKIRARQAAGKQFSIIVVAEGATCGRGNVDRAHGQGQLRAHPSWWSRRKTGSRDRGKNGYRIAVYCIRLFTKRRHAYTFRQSSFYALWCSSGRGLHAQGI